MKGERGGALFADTGKVGFAMFTSLGEVRFGNKKNKRRRDVAVEAKGDVA
jgi:hypothetical protein